MVKMFNVIPMEPHSKTVNNPDFLKKKAVADFLKILIYRSLQPLYTQAIHNVLLPNARLLGYWEGWVPVNRFNHTSWMTVVTPTDRPKSVRNRCVIEVFGGVFVLSIGFRIFCWYRGFRHRSESFFFSS